MLFRSVHENLGVVLLQREVLGASQVLIDTKHVLRRLRGQRVELSHVDVAVFADTDDVDGDPGRLGEMRAGHRPRLRNRFHHGRAVLDADPIAAIRRLNIHFIQQATSNPRQTKVFNIIFHRCEKTAEMENFIEERDGKRECLNKIQEIFELAVKQGALPPDTDTWIAVQITHSFLIGLVHEWLVDTSAYDLGAHGETMIDVMLAGLVARPPRKKP